MCVCVYAHTHTLMCKEFLDVLSWCFRAFSGKYSKHYDVGTYTCIVCQEPLFSSDTKYDSGCGWPAFNDVLDSGKVKLTKDTSNGKFF